MDDSRDPEQIGERLATIRAKLARMREESRASLAKLAAALDEADDRAAVRARDEASAEPDRPSVA